MGILNENFEWEPWMEMWWKTCQPMKETGEENWEINENILAP